MSTLQSVAVGLLCGFVGAGGVVLITRGNVAGGMAAIVLAAAVLLTAQWVRRR